MRTERIRIGPMVAQLPRRRPWKLAGETVTLDHLSGGTLTLGVGLGFPPDADEVAACGKTGVTWMCEPILDWRGTADEMRRWVRQGPPRT